MSGVALRTAAGSGRGGDASGRAAAAARRRHDPRASVGVGLWVFIGVATTLFSLFITAYVMRLSQADAAAIAMPWQLGLSTAWLMLGSVLLQRAASRDEAAGIEQARGLLLAGGACAAAFLVVQWWAWESLLAQRVGPAGNPAASFFYLLTAMHGLHVAGGLAGWTVTALAAAREQDLRAVQWRIALCARYWHFLLLVWLALLASFTFITPDVARVICRTA